MEERYFAASNSGSGFVSYFGEIFNPACFEHVYIIKGGPGTGKSYFMRMIADEAEKKGKKVILNPAPAQPLSAELLSHLYLVTPNETEAEMISGVKIIDEASANEAARVLSEKGVQNVIITLGSKGALVYNEGKSEVVPAYKVKAVDTTAAGDVFNGALTVALSEGRNLIEASRFGCKASAIAVTRPGAQSSAPYRNEVDIFGI